MKNKKGKEELRKILKVVYYDENAAMDYVTIMNDGNLTVEEINKAIDGDEAEIKAEGETSIKVSLIKMLKLATGIKSEISGHESNERIINSTITTNIMTEFMKLAQNDVNIEKISGIELKINSDTLTYLKSIFPYITLLNNYDNIEELKDIDINKFDEVILATKGYFEFVAYKNNKEIAIFRFNIDCLRNNYKFSDLLIMDLVFYGIKVGNTSIDKINIENEINKTQRVLTEDDLNETSQSDELPIYDIIIAGV